MSSFLIEEQDKDAIAIIPQLSGPSYKEKVRLKMATRIKDNGEPYSRAISYGVCPVCFGEDGGGVLVSNACTNCGSYIVEMTVVKQ